MEKAARISALAAMVKELTFAELMFLLNCAGVEWSHHSNPGQNLKLLRERVKLAIMNEEIDASKVTVIHCEEPYV